MKIGIAIDDWKLAVFTKHLERAGYVTSLHPGVSEKTLTLIVKTEDPIKLQKVVSQANDECRKSKSRIH